MPSLKWFETDNWVNKTIYLYIPEYAIKANKMLLTSAAFSENK